MPSGPGVRVDTALRPGERVPPDYDPMIAKIMTVGIDRTAAMRRMRRALDEVEVTGLQTTLPFHRFVARDASFRAGKLSTGWVAEHWDGAAQRHAAAELALRAAGLDALDQDGSDRPAGARPSGVPARPVVDEVDGVWRRQGIEDAVDRWPR